MKNPWQSNSSLLSSSSSPSSTFALFSSFISSTGSGWLSVILRPIFEPQQSKQALQMSRSHSESVQQSLSLRMVECPQRSQRVSNSQFWFWVCWKWCPKAHSKRLMGRGLHSMQQNSGCWVHYLQMALERRISWQLEQYWSWMKSQKSYSVALMCVAKLQYFRNTSSCPCRHRYSCLCFSYYRSQLSISGQRQEWALNYLRVGRGVHLWGLKGHWNWMRREGSGLIRKDLEHLLGQLMPLLLMLLMQWRQKICWQGPAHCMKPTALSQQMEHQRG